jgi:hypothetical protein
LRIRHWIKLLEFGLEELGASKVLAVLVVTLLAEKLLCEEVETVTDAFRPQAA